ncbi:hypothetical protein C437_05430 [Haloarcula vallismortis ATCC 29715]|uniref:Uncharacterized protein n=1 Tax=Haloarcula vallismortis ATCC 29715 TaxID=662477 RepID=M0JPK1_HALVA|nr:hypothetical protein C437_05430 [Haloarcula vallismortis ATCC 29715]
MIIKVKIAIRTLKILKPQKKKLDRLKLKQQTLDPKQRFQSEIETRLRCISVTTEKMTSPSYFKRPTHSLSLLVVEKYQKMMSSTLHWLIL